VTPSSLTLDVDGPRLLGRLAELARVGAAAEGGVTRLAWSPELDEAVGRVMSWAEPTKAACWSDDVGNLVLEHPGSEPDLPPLVTGSHLDTVVDGGPLDGAYGVVAGVEILAVLHETGTALRHPLRVVAFANEEGVVAPAFTGSRAVAGTFDPAELDQRGPDGTRLAERIGRKRGGRPAARWAGRVAASLELHIEQGPVLERAEHTIGVVTQITGTQRGTIRIVGLANHAGTTPLDARRDALVAAAQVILAVREIAASGPAEVATVGRVEVHPNVVNVIPGCCLLSVDLRAGHPVDIAAAVDVLRLALRAVASQTGTDISLELASLVPPVATDEGLRDVIRHAAAKRGLPAMEMVSGAGHDCAHLAGLGPVGLIFVPSRAGISHHPSEWTDPDHLVAGASVLLDTILAADRPR
jgi:hydantoinase/carbamoylase family amidase